MREVERRGVGTRRSRVPLLGRGAELQLLESVLEESCDGVPGFVVVSGEPGIGKTRLLEELSESATARGCLTLEGRAAEFERDLPFGLLTDALDDYLKSLDANALNRLAVDRLGAVAAVFPALRQLDDAVEYPVSATERFRVHHAVRELVERLAVRQPLVLVLDDLQWADGASLELIGYLLRRPPQAAFMLATGLRAGRVDAGVVKALGGSHDAGRMRTIDLGPLSIESVRQLIGTEAGLDAERLHHESGGNPFYALQLARAGAEALGAGPAGVPDVPVTVGRAIEAELEGLSAGSHALGEAAAVVGDPFDLDIVAATSGSSDEEAWSQIDELVSRDLVRETEIPRRFQFRHPLVRHAVYSSCSPSVRASCHRRAAGELLRRGAPAAAVAGHVEQSARHGDPTAVEILRRAGEETARLAPTSAARWFEAALRLLPPDHPADEHVSLLTQLASAQAAAGRFEDAHAALEEGIELLQAEGEPRVDLVVGCAAVEQLLGRHEESRARLRHAYEELADPRSSPGISLLIALSTSSLYLADYDGMLRWARLAVEAADAVDDAALAAAALATQTMGAAFAGEIALALELHPAAEAQVDALDDETVSSRLDALSSLATAELYLDLYAESCSHGERGLALARATGQTQLVPLMTPILGCALWMRGEMRRSAEVLDESIEAARLADNAQGTSLSLFNRSLSAVMAGDLETALELGAESVELASTVDNGVISAFAGAIHAQALLEAGKADAALELLLASVGGEDVPLLAGTWRATYLELLVRCFLAVQRLERAERAAARVREQADELGLRSALLMADRAAAAVALAGGTPEEAVRFAQSAVALAEEIGASVHASASRILAGRALAADGRPDEAIGQLERAAANFDELGAFRYRDQAEGELRALGHARHEPRRATRDDGGLDQLTDRELEVAQLVLDRCTNREIAERLFLSLKTVETHMHNIFTKLGVTSRVEVARSLSRAGLVENPAG
jgi:ATP/maltotriose-dependent transcriptional regulator MalT